MVAGDLVNGAKGVAVLARHQVNPAAVIAALESCKSRLIFFGVVAALAIVALIVAAVKKDWPKPLKFTLRAQSGLAILLATVNLICLGPVATMISLATGSGSISETSRNAAAKGLIDYDKNGVRRFHPVSALILCGGLDGTSLREYDLRRWGFDCRGTK